MQHKALLVWNEDNDGHCRDDGDDDNNNKNYFIVLFPMKKVQADTTIQYCKQKETVIKINTMDKHYAHIQ